MAVSGRRPAIARGARPSFAETGAPIIPNGSITRCMGRERSDSSPVNVAEKFWPAKIPASKRMVVPLLAQSSSPLGARKPSLPTP
jgi:hypothetical protein